MSKKRLIRPFRDPIRDVLSEYLTLEKQTTTWKSLAEHTYVAPSTLSKYANKHGRYIRADTLRGILRLCGMKLTITK